MSNNIACRIYAEQIKLLLSLPNQEEAKNVLYQALINSYNQFEKQNDFQNDNQIDNQIDNQNENAYVSVSVYKYLLELLSKNIVWKEFSNNYGGKRDKSGRKKTTKPVTRPVAEKKKKLTRDDVVDWESLFKYWEENKGGKKYANDDSRRDMLNRLKRLTKDNFEYAKVAIYEAINNGWQGFCGNDGLYYKGEIPSRVVKTPESFIELEDDNHRTAWYDTATNKFHYEIPLMNPDWSKWNGKNYIG